MNTYTHSNQDIAAHIAGMSRQSVMKELLHFQGRFNLDFSEAFLTGLPVDKLRHILLATQLQQGRGR